MSNAAVINATHNSGQLAGSPVTIEAGGDVVLKAFGSGSGAWSVTLAFAPSTSESPVTLTISNGPGRDRAQTSVMSTGATQWVGWVQSFSGEFEVSGIVCGDQPDEALAGDLGVFVPGTAPTKAIKAGATYRDTSGTQYTYGGAGWVGPQNRLPTFVNLGDSIDAVNCSYSYLGACSAGFANVHNAGVPGNNTTQMVARFSTDVAAYLPWLCHFKGGSNDVGQFVAHSVTLNNILTLKMMAEDIGSEFFMSIIPPRGDSFLSSAYALREKQKNLAAKYGIKTSDPFAAFVDPTTGGTTAGSFGVEGGGNTIVHPTQATHILASIALKNDLIKAYGEVPRLQTPLANIQGAGYINNPLMLSDTNADGKADGYSYGSFATFALATDSDFIGKVQKITNKVDGGYSVYSWAGGAAAGDVMLATVRLKKYTGDTSGFDFYVKDVASGERHYLIQNVSGAFSGQISQVWTQPNSTTGFEVVPSVDGSTIIDIGFGELQIYNLTALGLA